MELIGVGIVAGALVGLGIYGTMAHGSIIHKRKEFENVTQEIEQSLSQEESEWVSILSVLRRNNSNATIIENVTKARANLHGENGQARITQTYAFFDAAFAFFSKQTAFEAETRKKITDAHEKTKQLKLRYDDALKRYESHTNSFTGKLVMSLTGIEKEKKA